MTPQQQCSDLLRLADLGAIAAAITAPLFALALLGSGDMLTAVFCIALLLYWRHSENLQRIRAGTGWREARPLIRNALASP